MAGGLFHVVCKFHQNEFLLDLDGAREHYIACLVNALKRSDARLIAYCLMSSHVHLVLFLGSQALGALMRAVNSPWAIWINKTSGRVGTVMADRPWSVLCDSESYLLDLVRYVHNNPVRAGLAERAVDCVWSSHRVYVGAVEAPPWLDVQTVLGRFGDDVDGVRAAFDRYVDSGRLQPRRPELSGPTSRRLAKRLRAHVNGPVDVSFPVLGPDDFVAGVLRSEMEARKDREVVKNWPKAVGVRDVLEAVCHAVGLTPDSVVRRSRTRELVRARKLVAWVCCERLGHRQVDVAELFGVRQQSVNNLLVRMREAGTGTREQARMAEAIEDLRLQAVLRQASEEAVTSEQEGGSARLFLQKRTCGNDSC